MHPQRKKGWAYRLLVLLLLLPAARATAQTPSKPTETNKKIVQAGFDGWAGGTGNFFDLLADNMLWTITGTSPLSKTYRGKQPFLDEVITPLNARLSKKIVPTVRRLYADGDWVVALWDGKATARDGKPYHVTYSWHMRLAQGRIVEVIAFLDTLEFADIMSRVPAEK